jgi:hypothetical protein
VVQIRADAHTPVKRRLGRSWTDSPGASPDGLRVAAFYN